MKKYILFWLSFLLSAGVSWYLFKGFVSKWQLMWLLAVVIFFVCKDWSLNFKGVAKIGLVDKLKYFFCWVGLDAKIFLQRKENQTFAGKKLKYLRAFSQFAFGFCLFFIAKYLIAKDYSIFRAWVGMIGVVFCMHFGFFLAISIFWRSQGFNAKPLMKNPLVSKSVADFWGNRWNTAFRDFSYDNLFLPVFKLLKKNKSTKKISFYAGSFSVFFFSGIAHEAVISLPAGAGYGKPLTYFLIQFLATVIERKSKFIGSGFTSRIFTYFVVLLPVPLLFHKDFINLVIIPFIDEFGF